MHAERLFSIVKNLISDDIEVPISPFIDQLTVAVNNRLAQPDQPQQPQAVGQPMNFKMLEILLIDSVPVCVV